MADASEGGRTYICTECGEPMQLCAGCEKLLPHACGEEWGGYCYDCAPDVSTGSRDDELPVLPYPRGVAYGRD